jgi:hypothetical protein
MSNRLGIWCPACDRQGIVNSEMLKQMHAPGTGMMTKCTAGGHQYTMERLMAMKPRMVKLQFTEKQPGNTIQQQFWIYPEALAALRERWPNNLMTTMCSILTSLADNSSFLVEGEYARELAAASPPITRGREVAGMLHTIQQQEERIKNLEQQVQAGAKSAPPANSAQLDAIMAALGQAGIVVPMVGQSPVQPIHTTVQRDPDDVDYHEGDIDLNEQPPKIGEPPPFRGIPRPVPGQIR